MNSCKHLKKVLVEHGQEAVSRNEILAAHLQNCQACQQLLEAWSQIPDLLDQLPEHEPNEALLHKVSAAATTLGSGRNVESRGGTVQSRRRFIAPSLASAAVLLAAIGLSRELLMQESPTAHYLPARQRAAGELVQGPDSNVVIGADNVAIGQLDDGYLRSENLNGSTEQFEDAFQGLENQEVADKPSTLLHEGLAESFDYRGDDEAFAGGRKAREVGREIKNLELSSSRGSHADPESELEPDGKDHERSSERFYKEPGEFALRDSAEDAVSDMSFHYESQFRVESKDKEEFSVAAPPAAPLARHKQNSENLAESSLRAQIQQENKRLEESSITPQPTLESPTEEIRRGQARRWSDLEDLDGEFNFSSNGLSSREGDEVAQATEIKSRKDKGAKLDAAKVSAESAGVFELVVSAVKAPQTEVVGGAGFYVNTGFDFLAHYQQTQNLQFQQATGYWANSYIPGDPEIRLLNARLAQWDRSWLENNAQLEQDVEPVKQPFDAPADNALALSLMADASSVSTSDSSDAPTRMRLQIGIRGIEHRRGLRPAMNVGVVIDLPKDAPDEVRIATRALLDAMQQSKQAGDRFSLVLTGQDGEINNGKTRGLVVPANEFRFGSLQLAKQIILGRDSVPTDDSSEFSNLDLYAAVERAGAMVKQTDDPSRPLGSSSVLLISARDMPDIERLAALAHERAKEGITLSVIPLGSQPQNSSIEKLVLAGLGNRRYLEAPSQAQQLIEEELHASSRAVARAARLSIRLAPGVRLIEVVGSQRLDSNRAQRVREIENSMDRRLSANLGIQADRGEDEGGIQIVIPSIYSGDSVTVLLDIVADRPGAIADVSLRYKDLVFLRNGSLRGHLDLPGGDFSDRDSNRGPAQLAVLKNLLAHHFIEAVEQAAEALGRQQPAEAEAVLRAMRATINQARQALPAWANDKDLIHDQQVLDRYIAALASPRAGTHQSFLADSLRYAAWAKTHRPLKEWK